MKNKKNSVLVGGLGVIIFWLYASYSFFGKYYIPTHDGEYHIIRFYEFYKMLSAGYLFPRWAPGLNSGYGFPLFNFHYPFPNYVGALFHSLGVSFVDSLKYTLAFGYLTALIATYIGLIKKLPSIRALFSTIIFGTVPYWFVDLYIRGSVGEVWGIAWIMVGFASIFWDVPMLLSVSIAGVVLSHNIMAMIFFPIVCLYLIFYKKSLLINVLVGLGLSSYFWIPALWESKYMIGLNSVTFSDHFPALFQLLIPSWGSGFSQPGVTASEMSQQIGIVPLVTLTCSAITYCRLKVKRNSNNNWTIMTGSLFLGASIISILLLLEITIPLWNTFKFLQFIQYPWRLLSVLLVSSAFLFIFAIQRKWLQITLVICSLLLTIQYVRPVLYEPRADNYYLSKKEFTDGTSSLGNSFSTIWSPWKSQPAKQQVEILTGNATISDLDASLMNDTFTVNANEKSIIRINRYYFPGWTVTLDEKNIPIDYEKNGLLDISIPKGTYVIKSMLNTSGVQAFANSISTVSLGILIGLGILKQYYEHRI